MTLLSFAVPPGLSVDELIRRLGADVGLRADSPDTIDWLRRTYYDTFDGRLWRAGWVLEHEEPLADPGRGPAGGPLGAAPGTPWLRLRAIGSLLAVAEERVPAVPREPRSLGDERLRQRLSDLADERALLAIAAGPSGPEHHLRFLDAEEKTVARAIVAHLPAAYAPPAHLPSDPAPAEDSSPPAAAVAVDAAGGDLVVWALAVRGYDAELHELARRLGALLGEGREDDPMALAARRAGRTPGVDPSAFAVVLDDTLSGDEAARRLLGRLLDVMAANEAGVRNDVDTEFLHDFRVAVRRSRSILRAARAVLPEERWRPLAEELRWLGQLTSLPRDLDVLLEEDDFAVRDTPAPAPDLAAASASSALGRQDAGGSAVGAVALAGPLVATKAPEATVSTVEEAEEERRVDLVPFVAEVWAARRRARAELDVGLDSERYRDLLVLASATVAAPNPDGPSVVEHLGRQLRRASKSLLRSGRAAVSAEDWHEVRKAAKRLRYLIEGYRSLLDADAASRTLTALKGLQTVLGEAQDRAAHAALLRDLALEMAAVSPPGRDPSTARALLAAGGLVERHRNRGRKVQVHAREAFRAFDTAENRARLRSLLGGEPPAPGEPQPQPQVEVEVEADIEAEGDGGVVVEAGGGSPGVEVEAGG